MKIQVVRPDGRHEVLTLTEPLTLIRGEKLNRLVTQTGAEHWFTEEGLYDGWGMAVKLESPDGAGQFIDAVEADREILNPDGE